MNTCAFLSMDNLEEFECYDHLLVEPLARRGWSVEEVSWRNEEADWSQFDVVIIRSPWDYQQDPAAFMETLREIDQSSALLENKLELIEWNLNKTYLRDLQTQGIDIVPTLWKDTFNEKEFPGYFETFATDEIIIKPTVSANADDTFRISQNPDKDFIPTLNNTFRDRPFLVQPFMENIVSEGEFSLFFFGDTYSHTILKIPKTTDFRVQEEHGGRLEKVKPEPALLETARRTLQTLQPDPLYTRIDFVRTPDNRFALMELELIEPSLYFNMDEESPELFAKIFDRRMKVQMAERS